MPATSADREMVLRAFGESKAASAVITPEKPAAVEPVALIGNTWSKGAADQDAKSDGKEKDTKPEVVDLASASDTPVKKAPEKKPEEDSENKVEYEKTAVLNPATRRMLMTVLRNTGIGAGIGGATGLIAPAAGESRVGTALRRGIMGAGAGAGATAGAAMGGPLLEQSSIAKLLGGGAKSIAAPALGGASLLGLGTYGGYRAGKGIAGGPKPAKKPAETDETAKAPEKTEKPKTDEKAASIVARAMAKAGITPDVASGVLPSAADMVPDKQSPQQKSVGKPSKLNQLALAKGAADGDELEATSADNTPEAKTPAEATPVPSGDIPVLGATGGAVLGGLEKLLGAAGWQGGQQKLQQWGQSPTARNIAGGTTATLAAILSALAARKLMNRGQEDESMYAEAGMKLDLVKTALIGQSVPALKGGGDSVNDKHKIPVRLGTTTTHRGSIFNGVDKWSKGQ